MYLFHAFTYISPIIAPENALLCIRFNPLFVKVLIEKGYKGNN